MNTLSLPVNHQTDKPSSGRASSVIRVVIASIFGVIFMQLLTPVVTPSILLYGVLFLTYVGISFFIKVLRPNQ